MGIDESPILEKYEDDDHDGRIPDPPDEELDATPEIGDNYVNTEVMLPRGDHMARGKVIRRKRDAEGNPIGRENNNPILDTRQYEVQFADGEVTELTANVIAEAILPSVMKMAMSMFSLTHLLTFKSMELHFQWLIRR